MLVPRDRQETSVNTRRPNPTDAELADTLEHVRGVNRRKAERAEQRTRMAFSVTYKQATPDLLDQPEMQTLIARLGASCAEMAGDIDRVAYVKAVALDVLAARLRPRCPQGDRP
jgi:hypothetical protein